MTKEEFWNTVETCGKSPDRHEKLPSLFRQQAKEETLSFYVVTKNDALQVVRAKGLHFFYCVTGKKARVPKGCGVAEVSFDELVPQVINSGCEGFAFLFGDHFVGIELSDILGSHGSAS